MATIISRINNRVDVILAMTPPLTSDDTSSPHIDTSQIENVKAISANSHAPTTTIDVGVDGQHQCEFTLQEHEVPRNGKVVTIEPPSVAALAVGGGESVTPWNLCGETRSYISAHLNELTQPDRRQRNEIGAEQYNAPPIGLDVEGSQASYADDPDRDGQDSQATPAGKFGRIPTSSIPQLLSTSIAFSAGANQSVQQLGFVGDETSYPVIRGRQESFAFSVDGDDSVFKKVFGSPQEVIPTPHPNHWANIATNTTNSIAQSFGNNSNMSSSTLASESPYQNIEYTAESSYAQNSISSPPQNVSVKGNREPPLDMHQLSLSISSIVIPGKATSSQLKQGDQTKVWGARATQGLLPPHQSNPRQSAVPEVYSAISSLERYNPGSLDNKVILAKARGGYGRQKAFPGVPRKRTALSSDNSSIDGSVSSVAESKSSSAVSASMGWENSRSSGLNETDKSYHTGIGTMNEQIGMENTASIRQLPPEGKMPRSISSGHLSERDMNGTSERLEGKLTEINSMNVDRSVTINDQASMSRNKRRREKKVGIFRPSSDAYTPRMGHRAIKYKPVEERASVEKISSTMGTIQRPNFRDALRRVAIILHQHIVKIELRFKTGIHGVDGTGLFKASMKDEFNEENFATPRYKCSIVRVPMARPGVVYSMRKIRVVHATPTADEIYEFAHQLFKKVQLSSECSIVCLIYVEKLMEVAKVPLVAETWRPIFLCGLLLASKVWQDLSSWNIEFACVYPQFSLDAINRLELSFLKFIKWDLYISSR
jgi:hypothetical protein